MTIFTDGLRIEPENRGVTDYATSLGSSLGATVRETLADSPLSQLLGIGELEAAKGNDLSRMSGVDDALTFGGEVTPTPAPPTISKLEAADRVKAAGLDKDLKLPDQDTIAVPALDIMINRARDRREREAIMQRGPQGFLPSALSVGTSFLVGAIDPLNLASAFIPVMGELRYGKLLADAGTSSAGRTGVRLAVGGAQGAVGQAALEPLDWYAHTQDGRDFGMADVLHNLVFGAALGGGLHAAGGGIRDVYRARKGLAQYPFGPGEPMEHVDGIHVPESVLAEDGIAHADMPEHLRPRFEDLQLATDTSHLPLLNELAELESRNSSLRDVVNETIDRVGGDTTHPEVQRAFDAVDANRAVLRAKEDEFRNLASSPALAILRDLPPRAQEDSMRAALANIVDGEPVKVGEMLQAAAQTDTRIAESFEAWHGSPHQFDRFSLENIGSGEGAQTYGHGLYFAENEKVARSYQRATSEKAFVDKVLYDESFSPDDAWAEIKDNWSDFTPPEQRLMTALEKDDWLGFDYPHQAVNAAIRDIKRFDVSPETVAAASGIGNLYRVKITANKDHMLDWDQPLSYQPAEVQQRLKDVGIPIGREYGPRDGRGAYSWLEQQKRGTASALLNDAGIPGIKYLDQGSRPGPGGMNSAGMTLAEPPKTRNFVVFDDKHIEIVDRNGEPVAKPFTESHAGDRKTLLPDPDLVTAPKPRGRAAAHPDTLSLNEHLASKGGLRPDPELEAIYGSTRGPFVPGFGPLIRQSGMALDEALSSAKQNGYLFDPHDAENGTAGAGGRTSHGLTPNDLLEHLDAENRGQKLYKAGHVEATKFDPEQEKHVVLGHVEAEFEAAGLKVSDIDGKLLDRTVEIVHREGERDVLAAYERAILEDEERYHAIAAARDAADAHPGRDVPFDAGAAPGRGGADPLAGGPTRRTGPGERGPDGAQPSLDRAGDPGARDAAWRELAATQPDIADAGLLEASRAADKLPEQVETNLDKRVTAAEKADAYAKQMFDMFAERLSPEDRLRLEDRLKSLDDDFATRKEVIERSGACLYGARA